MFYPRINQIVGFYQQNVWKAPVNKWHFASKTQLTGFYIIGKLVENGLNFF